MAPEAAQSDKDLYSAINKATVVILAWTLLDKLLAVGKEMLLAREFGIDVGLDVFNLAFAVPGIVTLLVNSAFYSAFIPIYLEWRENTPKHLVRDKVMTVFTASLAVLALATLAGWLAAPLYFPLVGYGLEPAQQQLGVSMERALVFMVLLEGVAVLLAALLQAWKTFAAVTFAQSLVNISLIAFLLLGGGMGIELLVWGVLCGHGAKALFLAACVIRRGFPLWPRFVLRSEVLWPFACLAGPLLGSALIVNSILVVDQSMASQLSPGGVSSLRYAYRINDLPLQLVIIAISRAIFPYISENVAKGEHGAMRHVFMRSLILVGVITFPVMSFGIVFAPDIVGLLLKRGAFGEEAALRTALSLQCYMTGLFFFAYSFINGAFFSALKRVRTLFVMGVLSLALNVGLNLVFIRLYQGVHGIALSSSLSSAIVCLIFFALLHKELELRMRGSELRSLAAPLLAALGLGLACHPLRGVLADAGLGLLPSLAIWGTGFFGCYGLLVFLLRTPELTEALSMGRLPGVIRRFMPGNRD